MSGLILIGISIFDHGVRDGASGQENCHIIQRAPNDPQRRWRDRYQDLSQRSPASLNGGIDSRSVTGTRSHPLAAGL
jgi:hypothetical protein